MKCNYCLEEISHVFLAAHLKGHLDDQPRRKTAVKVVRARIRANLTEKGMALGGYKDADK